MKLLENLKLTNQERKVKELTERANTLFQVQEHRGELWFTVNDCPVMPTSFLKNDVLDTLKQIRELYINERLK